jgi:hypothetical protein
MSKSNNSSVVTIDLTTHPPQKPLGMLLAPSAVSNEHHVASAHIKNNAKQLSVTLVAGWEHLPSELGKSSQLGPIQRSGLVRLGDRLVRINGRDITDWSFREVMDTLKQFMSSSDTSGKKRLKSLGFAPRNSYEWGRNTEFDRESPMLFGLLDGKQVHEKRLYSFASYIGRWRVTVDDDQNFNSATTYGDAIQEDDETDLEEHLNKEPMQTPSPAEPNRTNNASATGKTPKPYIQYEIKCHLMFHSKSFKRKQNHAYNVYSWSVWKRYSQFRLLDAELRSMHGWQMDAIDEGRGIAFPRERYLETFWYDVYGAVNNYFFSSNSNDDDEDDIRHVAKVDSEDTADIPENCPYPKQFISKRLHELTTYWSNLMRIEEMFEFDINNHKFAKTMASFLEVDRILMKRSSTQSVSGASRLSRPAVIHEEMVNGLGELILPSGTIPVGREDDDVSLLSDGTGLRDSLDYGSSPLRNAMHQQLQQRKFGDGASTSSSVVSKTSMSSARRRAGPRQGAKPAFQREYLGV